MRRAKDGDLLWTTLSGCSSLRQNLSMASTTMFYIEPDESQLASFAAQYPADRPVVMLNLLHFADQAHYLPEQNAEPCTGREAFVRYGGAVMPLIEAHGGEQLWQGAQRTMLIGPDDKDWHLVVLVKYPSAQAFVDMVTSEAYQAIVYHRAAALVDSRLIALEPL